MFSLKGLLGLEEETYFQPVSYLKHRDIVLPVDFVGGWVEPAALLHVLVEDAATLHVAEAKLTQVELG